ncbi:hypothetical protein PHLCEN_2v3431 [Hermanssonia centrifuga]|uniref:Uncharacterized protein n=1 Tax=Hermanssonia centrifuga TaxID=98765 RepID=A0A2R6QIS1_9APHY|nr:hypothetical protein PHLCEN_2v3431 [Hermanssonia centrifuga]
MAAYVGEASPDRFVAQLDDISDPSIGLRFSPDTDSITPEEHKQLDDEVYVKMDLPEVADLTDCGGVGQAILTYVVETCPLKYRREGRGGQVVVEHYYNLKQSKLFGVIARMYRARHSFTEIRRISE